MGARRLLSLSDALVLLGGDPPALAALDRALGGAMNVVTGGASDGLLRIADARGRILGLGRDLVRGVGQRLGRAEGRAARSDLLHAAHTVIVVVAWFEALQEQRLPFTLEEVELTGSEQLALAGARTSAGRGSTEFARSLVAVDAPRPAPHLPAEEVPRLLAAWYAQLSRRFLGFLTGLELWVRLGYSAREEAGHVLATELPAAAAERYEALFAQLALQAPEFGFWAARLDHQATRAEVRRGLTGVESLLSDVARALRPPVDVAAALARSHQAVLARPVLDTTQAPEGITVPALRQLYLDPDFRVRPVAGQSGPADETWWEQAPVRGDLTRYLAGALTAPGLTQAPLLVLGQPGAGKSVLTRVLAARLPAAGFLPVRVPLRDVRAEDELQDQIEQAVRSATGERVSWPELVRSAGGTMPVLLLDGFDELLQTTGVHHNDFLARVAGFQQREADQGRPVLAMVTSRTAVADRARYPEGMVALRLEPFRPEQIRHWLSVWNAANAAGLAARGLRALDWEVVARHGALAAQPLLLTMLALYDAADNALQRHADGPRDEAELYEELLGLFARREVGKTTRDAVPDDETRQRVEQELQRLSLVAFALHNRRRQWVSAAELDGDLTALLGRRVPQVSSFRTPLGAAEVALGRFFFVQRAQSIRDGQVLSTYEFLHATFGEYLVVRLALHLLRDLQRHRPSLSIGDTRIDDDLAYALMSYAPLSTRQMPRFATSLVGRMTGDERERLARLLIRVHQQHTVRTGDQHPDYRPRTLRTASRHGIYSANLVLVILLLTGGTTAAELFPDSDDPVGAWHRHVLLWRSAFDEEQWTDFALSVTVHRTWQGETRSLELAPRHEHGRGPDPVDGRWLYRHRPGDRPVAWSRSYWNDIWHKMDVAGGTNDTTVRHALDPVFARLGPAITTFVVTGDGEPSSVAHDLLRLWIEGHSGISAEDAELLHSRLFRALRLFRQQLSPIAPLLLDLLRRDRNRITETTLLTAGSLLLELDRPVRTEAARFLVGTLRPAPHADVLLTAAMKELLACDVVFGLETWSAAGESGYHRYGPDVAQRVAAAAHRTDLPSGLRERVHRILDQHPREQPAQDA